MKVDFKPLVHMASVADRDGWQQPELQAIQERALLVVGEAVANMRGDAPALLDIRANGKDFLRMFGRESSFTIDRLSVAARFDPAQNRQVPHPDQLCWQTVGVYGSRQEASQELEKRSPSLTPAEVFDRWHSVRKEALRRHPVAAWKWAFAVRFDVLHFWLDVLDAERNAHNVAGLFGATSALAQSLVELPHRSAAENALFARALGPHARTIVLGQQALAMKWAADEQFKDEHEQQSP